MTTENKTAAPAKKAKAAKTVAPVPGKQTGSDFMIEPIVKVRKRTAEEMKEFQKEQDELEKKWAAERKAERQQELYDTLKTVTAALPDIRTEMRLLTLHDCIAQAFNGLCSRASNEAACDDIAARAIALGTALFNQLQ